MKFDEISCYATVNATDGAKVAELAESMKENGWKGAPILVCNMGLVTGSHRLAALKAIDSDAEYDGEVLYEDVAEDVTDEINDYCERTTPTRRSRSRRATTAATSATWTTTARPSTASARASSSCTPRAGRARGAPSATARDGPAARR